MSFVAINTFWEEECYFFPDRYFNAIFCVWLCNLGNLKIFLGYTMFVFENDADHGKIARRVDLKAVPIYAPMCCGIP